MQILNHFQNLQLTADQQNALTQIDAFLDSKDHVFILQGYAGSGKTTILKGLTQYLEAKQESFQLMAPTGRAAKILRDKTGFGATIHKTIYNLEELVAIQDKEEKEDVSHKYYFPLRSEGRPGVLIIDEASMVSHRSSQHEIFSFGTSILLADLLTYSGLPGDGCKIIFVGDPAQLPPVGDKDSKALMPAFFEQMGLRTQIACLREVLRQKDNQILKNATIIRELIESETKPGIELGYAEDSFVKIDSQDIAARFAETFPVPEFDQGAIIAHSNQACQQYNLAVRKKIFPAEPSVTAGDLLMVNQNNYHTYETELLNGETIKVMTVSSQLITHPNIPVYEFVNGKKVRQAVTLQFREITFRVEGYDKEVRALIVENLLHSPYRDLTILEMKALYVDFNIRWSNAQSGRKAQGQPTYGYGSSEFKTALRTDQFYNALRVKFGYAITCHKAQGGEWETTFVDYSGRTALTNDPLRWAYTATTRASRKCYAANAPYVSCFSAFRIDEIKTLTNVPPDALSLGNVLLSPFHKNTDHKAKSLKFWEIDKKLRESPFRLVNVATPGPFHERYTIEFDEESTVFDATHNGAGMFSAFHTANRQANEWQKEVIALLDAPAEVVFSIDYKPSSELLEKLYGLMLSACDEAEVTITNIKEQTTNYFVRYYLKSDAKCAFIQFYFNGDQQLTRAIIQSTDGPADEKMITLISKIRNHVA